MEKKKKGGDRPRRTDEVFFFSIQEVTHLLDEGNGEGGAALVGGELLLPPLLHGPLVTSSVRLGVVAASSHLSHSLTVLVTPGGTLGFRRNGCRRSRARRSEER